MLKIKYTAKYAIKYWTFVLEIFHFLSYWGLVSREKVKMNSSIAFRYN